MVNLTKGQILLLSGITSFVIGLTLGIAGRHEPEQMKPQPAMTVTVTKEVDGPATAVTKREIPEKCKEAVNAALKSQQVIQAYEAKVGTLPRLIDDAGVAIAGKNQNKLNGIRDQQIQLEADTIRNLLDLHDVQDEMQKVGPLCAAALKGE